MDPSAKTFLALAIVLGGITTALVFHRDAPSPDSPGATDCNRLICQEPVEPPDPEPAATAFPLVRLEASVPRPQRAPKAKPAAAILTPIDPGEPPPALARSYPQGDFNVTSRWGATLGLGPASDSRSADAGSAEKQRRHKVVDGDTLKALAKRYLGSVDRCLEIYEANRDVLPNPEVLPIGAELKIPPRAQASPPTLTPREPLAPVASGQPG